MQRTKAATLFSSVFSLFSIPRLLPWNAAICEPCVYLSLSLCVSLSLRLVLFSFTTPTIVCAEAAFCIKAFFFFLPSHLTVYCLLKAHRSISKNENWFHSARLKKKKQTNKKNKAGSAVHLKAADHGNRRSTKQNKTKQKKSTIGVIAASYSLDIPHSWGSSVRVDYRMR